MLVNNERIQGLNGKLQSIIRFPKNREGAKCDLQVQDPASMADAISNVQLSQESLSAVFPSA